MIERHVVARWESRSGKHWIDLTHDPLGYMYFSPQAAGNVGDVSFDEAVESVERKITLGMFQPDRNKLPLKRVL